MSDEAGFLECVRNGDAAAAGRMVSEDPSLLGAKTPQGVSAVLLACYTGRKEIRDLLIERGAQLELHEATAAGRLAKIREFVEPNPGLAKGFSPDGFPLVALAAAFGHEDVVGYLHSKGADINAPATNGSGYNALTGAVAGGHTAIATWLVSNGADVNHRYAKGHSPLLEAAANGNLAIVKMLIANGADPQMRTEAGKSALTFAEERKHPELAAYLKELGLTA